MIGLLLALCPSFLHVFIRRLLGQKIAKTAKLNFGTVLLSRDITIGEYSSLGPFVFLSAKKINIGSQSSVRGPSFLSCHEIRLDRNSRISSLVIVRSEKKPTALFHLGNCSSVFPMCWIEPGEGVVIEEQVSIGGFSLIFTHGVWPSYLDGGPMLRAPVRVGHHTYVPWKVFILPGVEIGSYSVIGAGSVVNKSIPEQSLAGGVPAKVIRTPAYELTSLAEKHARLNEVLREYCRESGATLGEDQLLDQNGDVFKIDFSQEESKLLMTSKDVVLNFINSTCSTTDFKKAGSLIAFFRQYGIRFSPQEEKGN